MRENLVLVGNGMAGVRTLEELLKHNDDQYNITVIGAEPHPNYNRIMLSPVLAGEKTIDDIILNARDWYEDNDIALITGDPVVEIDHRRRHTRPGRVVDPLQVVVAPLPCLHPLEPGEPETGFGHGRQGRPPTPGQGV